MTIPPIVRDQVRQRAHFTCEFCGVSETDSGGDLTLDHFRPLAEGGGDNLDNLLYCCVRCNQYKSDYWPKDLDDLPLWNPLAEPATLHFFEMEDGGLHPLSQVGAFTLRRLRLNRPALLVNRLQRRRILDEIQLLARYRDLVHVLESLMIQQTALIEEQQSLLKEQSELLKLLIDKR